MKEFIAVVSSVCTMGLGLVAVITGFVYTFRGEQQWGLVFILLGIISMRGEIR